MQGSTTNDIIKGGLIGGALGGGVGLLITQHKIKKAIENNPSLTADPERLAAYKRKSD